MSKLKIAILGAISIAMVFALTTMNNFGHNHKQREYTGTKKCKMCHMSSKKGAQYKAWEDGPHAKAYKTLGTAEAKKIAKEMGIADPQKDGKCLKCHVTAYGVDEKFLDKKFDMTDGVSCESCHGAGGDYYKKNVMEDLSKGKIKPEEVGLVIPSEQLCKTCHNEESPTYKEFDYNKMYKKIAHPMPDDYKKQEGYPID